MEGLSLLMLNGNTLIRVECAYILVKPFISSGFRGRSRAVAFYILEVKRL
jgi:hypothetical protein